MDERQLEVAMREEAVRCNVAGQKYSATFDLYRACCMDGDNAGSDSYRQQLHVLLDMLLDSIATSQMLQKQFSDLRK